MSKTQYFEFAENNSTDGDQIIEIDDNDKQTEDTENLWSIEDDTFFQPLGLINHGNENKSVFLTWNEHYLLNFVFKKSQKSGKTKLTKVRLDVQGEEIRQILILELNTLLLMQSGRVFHFSLVKTMHPVRWLSDVRAISSATEGFSVIRTHAMDSSLHLEVYKDVTNLELNESTLQKSYDITFDETNIFNCKWEDEHFTLYSQNVNDENREFLGNVIRNESRIQHLIGDIHFFTISGGIYALLPSDSMEIKTSQEHPEYFIQICATYAVNIEFIKILCTRQLYLIFLQCGTIEIWYRSELTQNLQRTTYYSGAHFVHYEFANTNGCFYYTNEEQVAQIQFYYDKKKNNCLVLEKAKAVYGMMACTWMESIQQLICLSCNNIFYQLAFDAEINNDENYQADFQDARVESENLNELYELSTARMARLLDKANILEELQHVPSEIHKLIEKEFVKQELLAVSTKLHIYRKLFKVSLEFSLHLPLASSLNDNDITYIHTSSNCILSNKSLFTLIYLNIVKHDIFQRSFWNICICFGTNCIILNIPQNIMQKDLCIIIPLIRHEQELLPKFELFLSTLVKIESDFVAISLPLALEINCKSIINLFTTSPLMYRTIKTTPSIKRLVAVFNGNKSDKKEMKNILWKLHLEKNNLIEISQIFNVKCSNDEGNHFELYFMSLSIKISHNIADNSICLECKDAAALYYVKYVILNTLDMISTDCDFEESKNLIMQSQADIERCYGNLMDIDNEATDTLHLETMLRSYAKLREELSKRYK